MAHFGNDVPTLRVNLPVWTILPDSSRVDEGNATRRRYF